MTFPQSDICGRCRAEIAPEWVPPVVCGSKVLAGTGRWNTQLEDEMCPSCRESAMRARAKENRNLEQRRRLIEILGGEKPYREFTFAHYEITAGNRMAFTKASGFNPQTDNLYFWGSCGVGKTHLAYATARRCFEEGRTVAILKPSELLRQIRRWAKDPSEEQFAIDRFVRVEVLVIDDFGIGGDTPYARQILQEIFDGRDYKDRAGTIFTSKYSLSQLAQKLDEDTIPSRLAGLCQVVEVTGPDQRLAVHPSTIQS
jgi:DNA replication protein DnaC